MNGGIVVRGGIHGGVRRVFRTIIFDNAETVLTALWDGVGFGHAINLNSGSGLRDRDAIIGVAKTHELATSGASLLGLVRGETFRSKAEAALDGIGGEFLIGVVPRLRIAGFYRGRFGELRRSIFDGVLGVGGGRGYSRGKSSGSRGGGIAGGAGEAVDDAAAARASSDLGRLRNGGFWRFDRSGGFGDLCCFRRGGSDSIFNSGDGNRGRRRGGDFDLTFFRANRGDLRRAGGFETGVLGTGARVDDNRGLFRRGLGDFRGFWVEFERGMNNWSGLFGLSSTENSRGGRAGGFDFALTRGVMKAGGRFRIATFRTAMCGVDNFFGGGAEIIAQTGGIFARIHGIDSFFGGADRDDGRFRGFDGFFGGLRSGFWDRGRL